ncbi:hypothetical protein MKX03_014352, partial [Papaver bracteatum]
VRRDADDVRIFLDGHDVNGIRIIAEFAKGVVVEVAGEGSCFNYGLDGHWARDCKA